MAKDRKTFFGNDSIIAFNNLIDAIDAFLKTMRLKDDAYLVLKIILDCKHGDLLRIERHFGDWEKDD